MNNTTKQNLVQENNSFRELYDLRGPLEVIARCEAEIASQREFQEMIKKEFNNPQVGKHALTDFALYKKETEEVLELRERIAVLEQDLAIEKKLHGKTKQKLRDTEEALRGANCRCANQSMQLQDLRKENAQLQKENSVLDMELERTFKIRKQLEGAGYGN